MTIQTLSDHLDSPGGNPQAPGDHAESLHGHHEATKGYAKAV